MKLTLQTFAHGLRHGYWFCEHCDRVVTLAVERENTWNGAQTCPHCQKATAYWHAPVLTSLQPV